MSDLEPVETDDVVVRVRIRAAHWEALTSDGGLELLGDSLRLVLQPDGVYGLKEEA